MPCTNLAPFLAGTILEDTPRLKSCLIAVPYPVCKITALSHLSLMRHFLKELLHFVIPLIQIFPCGCFCSVDTEVLWLPPCKVRPSFQEGLLPVEAWENTSKVPATLWIITEVFACNPANVFPHQSKPYSLEHLTCYHYLFLFLRSQDSGSTCTYLYPSLMNVVC